MFFLALELVYNLLLVAYIVGSHHISFGFDGDTKQLSFLKLGIHKKVLKAVAVCFIAPKLEFF